MKGSEWFTLQSKISCPIETPNPQNFQNERIQDEINRNKRNKSEIKQQYQSQNNPFNLIENESPRINRPGKDLTGFFKTVN